MRPVRRAAAGCEVLRLLLTVRSVERGGRAGVALADHVDSNDTESDPGEQGWVTDKHCR